MFVVEERQKSEFNMAVSYLNRLNALFYVADEAAMSLDTYTWFHSLMAIYRELSTELNPGEMKEFERMTDELSNKVNIVMGEQNKGRMEVDQSVYKDLHGFEIKLRRIMKDSGLQMKMQDDAMNALR